MRWDVIQKHFSRNGYKRFFNPDIVLFAGSWGGNDNVRQITKELRDVATEEKCHDYRNTLLLSALEMMTNHDFANNPSRWFAWYEHNQHSSQDDWIRQGFEAFGVSVHDNLQLQTKIALLKLMADKNSPQFIQWNAFRWLRKDGFSPDSLDPLNISTEDERREVLRGLIKYSQTITKFPQDNSPIFMGIRKESSQAEFELPYIVHPYAEPIVTITIFIIGLAGVIMLKKGSKIRQKM